MKHVFPSLAGLSALLLSACTKEKIVIREVPVEHSWRQDSSLQGYNKILLAATPLADSSLAVATSGAVWYVRPDNLRPPISGAYFLSNPNYGYLVPPSLNPEVSVTVVNPTTLLIFATRAPVSTGASFAYRATYSNSTTSNKTFPLPNPRQSGYPVLNSRYILVPTEQDLQEIRCSLLRVGPTASARPSEPTVALKATRPVTLTAASGTVGFEEGGYYSATYFNKFFVSTGGQFFRVDTLGRAKTFGFAPVPGVRGRVGQMFTLGGNLFAVSGADVFVSNDQGENWRLYTTFTESIFTQLTFRNAGKHLYAFYQSQLWRVKLNGNDLQFEELDNDGLATSQITSVTRLGRHAFVTTLSGLFYRDTVDFHTVKK